MSFKEKFGAEPGERKEPAEPGERAEGAALNPEFHPSDEDLLLEQALVNFRSSVHAWSAAEYSRVRPAVKVVRQRSWRLAAGWALAGLLVAGGAGGGVYEHHRQETARIAAAARLAEQQRLAGEQRAREVEEEDLLAKVDRDVSRQVPSAMEPLAQLMAEDEGK